MKTLCNPWFIAGCLVWLVSFSLKKLHYQVPLVNGYLTDAFAIPVIANLGLWFQRVLVYRRNSYVLKPGHVIFVVMYVSLVFELILPRYSARYTGDYVDVLLYIAGGLFFYFRMNKPANS